MNTENYSNQRLKDYALWYYFRYYPSNKRLLQKLREKGSEEDTNNVFKDIQHLLQEEEIIKAKIDNYIFRNKNYRYIEQKMAEKLFPKEGVSKYLETHKNSGKSLLSEEFLRKKIENYKVKGKSKYYIFQTLGETKEDRELLKQLLGEYFVDGEVENIRREYEKLGSKYTRDKVIQKLIAKGFRYDEIKRVLLR